MMTVITTTRLHRGAEQEWDSIIEQRFRSAHDRPGWVSGQLLTPADNPDTRLIVGTWRSREEWEAWHDDPGFLQQRTRLEELEAEPSITAWYTVVADGQVSSDAS